MQLDKKPELDALNQETESSAKKKSPDKKRKSLGGTLLKITFIYFPVGIILAAIVLPNFLDCSNKAKQSEAKQYVGLMTRAQQAYFAEKGTFATSLDALSIGLKSQTANYNYSVITSKTSAFIYGVTRKGTKGVKSVVAAIFLVPTPLSNANTAADKTTTATILCIAQSEGTAKLDDPTNINSELACGDGTVEVAK